MPLCIKVESKCVLLHANSCRMPQSRPSWGGKDRGVELQHLEQTAKQSEMFYLWALPGRGVECHMRCSNKTNNESVSCFASIPQSPPSGSPFPTAACCCCRRLSTARQMNNFNKCKTAPAHCCLARLDLKDFAYKSNTLTKLTMSM